MLLPALLFCPLAAGEPTRQSRRATNPWGSQAWAGAVGDVGVGGAVGDAGLEWGAVEDAGVDWGAVGKPWLPGQEVGALWALFGPGLVEVRGEKSRVLCRQKSWG